MIRYPGASAPPQDPKLKLPPIGSEPARAAAERSGSTAEIAGLRREIAALTASVAALAQRVAILEAPGVTQSVTEPGNAGNAVTVGNAPKLSAAEKMRAYRERRKAKA